jgi:16S rRNA processing protein RimM
VIRPHGLEGVLRVQSYAETENSFIEAGSVFLKTAENETREFPVVSARSHKTIVLLELGGLDSIEAAESFRGADVYVLRDALKIEHEDEFFWFELIGLEVNLASGERIGTLARIMPTGGHDVYVVQTDGKDLLIPGTREVIEEIDLEQNRMTIAHMEDLLDLNEV